MTNDDRLNRLEDQMIDIRMAVSAMLDTITQHQRNFETIQRNFELTQRNIENLTIAIREIRDDTREMQLEIRGLQTENRRILDILQRRQDSEE